MRDTMQLTDFQSYKHDTVGKFNNISNLINLLEKNHFSEIDEAEVLNVIDETLAKMSQASKKYIEIKKMIINDAAIN